MMIAFYFGDRSLKYLQKRWNASREEVYLKNKSKADGSEAAAPDVDDVSFEDKLFVQELGEEQAMRKPMISLTSQKKAIATSETVTYPVGSPAPTGLIPIIDAGHGGLDAEGNYTTGNKKLYTFKDADGIEDVTIYEGVISREIAKKLIVLLDENNLKYEEMTVETVEDISLERRVAHANELYAENKNHYFLSIHSNAFKEVAPGKGSKAKGFEVYTSVGQTKSDHLADIISKRYKKEFTDFSFRQNIEDGDLDKERNYYVLRNTACPAVLVENLFFDNPKEAAFLMSEAGQMRIATCLFRAIKEIYETESNGVLV